MNKHTLQAALERIVAGTFRPSPELTVEIEVVEAGDHDENWLEADIDITVPASRLDSFRDSLRSLVDALEDDGAWEFDGDEDVEEAEDGWRLTVVVRLGER